MVDELSSTMPHFKQIQWLEKTESTNADLLTKARADHGPQARPWLVGAHLQEHGRGRAGRRWQNRPGANLMFSCVFDVFITPQQLATLSPLAGLAACEALRELVQAQHRKTLRDRTGTLLNSSPSSEPSMPSSALQKKKS